MARKVAIVGALSTVHYSGISGTTYNEATTVCTTTLCRSCRVALSIVLWARFSATKLCHFAMW